MWVSAHISLQLCSNATLEADSQSWVSGLESWDYESPNNLKSTKLHNTYIKCFTNNSVFTPTQALLLYHFNGFVTEVCIGHLRLIFVEHAFLSEQLQQGNVVFGLFISSSFT